MQHQRPQIPLPQQSSEPAAPAAGVVAAAMMAAMAEWPAGEPPFLRLMMMIVVAMLMALSHLSFSFSMFDIT